MVTSVTSLTRNGLRDWLIQRVTALILAAYTLFLFGYIICHHSLQYNQWHGLFTNGWMRVFTFLALLSLVYHTWVGVWTVLTDYIKPTALRFALQVFVCLVLLGYLVWGVDIVWSI